MPPPKPDASGIVQRADGTKVHRFFGGIEKPRRALVNDQRTGKPLLGSRSRPAPVAPDLSKSQIEVHVAVSEGGKEGTVQDAGAASVPSTP